MAGFRDKFIYITGKGIKIIPTRFLQRITNQRLILPFYHVISDNDLPHIKHLYQFKTVKAFIDDLDFLLKHHSPIDYKEFKELSKNKQQPKKPSFLLSFDDGLKEFHDVIAPILIKKGIPAICFLNSGFIDNKDLFFRFKSSLLINEITLNPNVLQKFKEVSDNTINTPQDILSVSYQKKDLLDKLAKSIEFSFSDFLANQKPYLSSNQIQSLIKQGFHFGAHSIDHPEYRFLDINEQIRQTKVSVGDICNTFSLDYKIFSFPFTDYNVTKEFFRKINSNGITENTFACAGQKKDVIANNFQRLDFEMAHFSAKQILNSELLYYMVKTLLGKNTIIRND